MGAPRPAGEAPDILKGPDNHLDTLTLLPLNRAAIFALPAQTEASISSLLEALMSIRFLPAAMLPSGDKVVSTQDAACWWAVKVSVGF